MELLAETEAHEQGRWIIAPRKGARFVGTQARAQMRARERRRRVFAFFIESIGLTFLIGLVPPLRVMWLVSGALFGLLALYVWLLVSLNQRNPRALARERADAAAVPKQPAPPAAERYVAEGRSRRARPSFNGLGSLAESELANIVVRRARDVGIAGA